MVEGSIAAANHCTTPTIRCPLPTSILTPSWSDYPYHPVLLLPTGGWPWPLPPPISTAVAVEKTYVANKKVCVEHVLQTKKLVL